MPRRRGRWTFPRLGWFLFALLCIGGAGVFRTISVYGRFSQRQLSRRQFSENRAAPAGMVTDAVPVRGALEVRRGRTVYPYSIIRGGVASVAEFTAALRRDAVVAGHYAGFHQETLRTMQAPKSMLLYASYRIGDAVYWTTHRIHIAAGELLITDGASLARGRCGNRLSNSPQSPLHPDEPTETEMNTPNSFNFVAPTTTAYGSPNQWLGPIPPSAPVSALVFELFPPASLAGGVPGALPNFPGMSGGTLGSGGFVGVGSAPGTSLPSGGSTVNPGSVPTAPPIPSLPPLPPPGIVGEPSAPPILDSAPGWINWQPIVPPSELNPIALPPVKIGQGYPPVIPGSPGGGGGFPIEPGGGGDSGTNPAQPPTSNPLPGEGPGGIEPSAPGTSIGNSDSPGPSQIIPEPAAAALAGVGLMCLWLAARRFKARSH